MAADDSRAELSSLSTMLEELTARVSSIAEGVGSSNEAVVVGLFEVERHLQSASRRLAKLVGETR